MRKIYTPFFELKDPAEATQYFMNIFLFIFFLQCALILFYFIKIFFNFYMTILAWN